MYIINLHKNLGETPKEALERFRLNNPKYKESRLTYAGRLDPMAEGVLLILEGDYTDKDKLDILNLNKEYYFEILWGFKSDSFDILGKLEKGDSSLFDEKKLTNILKEIKNLKEMSYPPFSSKTLDGVPLFKLAREGKLDESKIPKRKMQIFSLEKITDFEISRDKLLSLILERISLVQGDFRQEETKNMWKSFLQTSTYNNFLISSFCAEVSSGTYIRSIVNLLGEKMGSGGLCFRIIRENVGEYSKIESII